MQETKFLFFRRGLWAALGLAAGAGCYRNTRVTADIRVPEMRCEACVARIRSSLSTLAPEALLNHSVDLDRRTVRAIYESELIALRNIQHAIAEAGFDADDIPAYPEAKNALPESCRPHRNP